MAESMVELTPSYELENQLLDDDHRRLVDPINAVVQALDEGRPEDCVKLVPEFVEVAKKHFKREEALLEHYGYPEIQKHRDHHMGLDDKMDTMLMLAGNSAENETARQSLRKELIYFLMDDVINADLDFKGFLAAAAAHE
ncbi:MAG TPA: hemerythrin family protein [Alphaproteobacteria bacterium]|jgi:hemerythrin|nr:hemerythrin family protein [Alphaproteobacteria bacterium]HJM48320.1 hemerythrin family protein [Alphaproteobacteria bacterium]